MAIRRLTALALTVAVAAALAPAAAFASMPTAQEALSELNAWRAEGGLEPVTALDPELSEGCRLHNSYMALHGLGHFEHPSLPGYTELGAYAGVTSVLGSVEAGPRALWEDAVYHRMGLLEPRLRTTWFDASAGATCMGVWGVATDAGVRTDTLTLRPWPAPGMRNVETTFTGGETPDPGAAVPGDSHLGYLLSVNVNGPWFSALGTVLTAVSLTPDGGAPVPVTGVDRNSAEGAFLSGGFALFPNQPLTAATWYTARATGYVTGIDVGPSRIDYPFDTSWRFATVGAGPDPNPAGIGETTNPGPGPAPPGATRATSLSVSGRLRGGKLATTVTVKPASKRTLSIRVQRSRRGRWVTVRRLQRPAKARQTLRITVPRAVRTVRVSVTAPAAAGYAAASAARTVRRVG